MLLDGDDLILDPGEIVTVQSWVDLDRAASDLGLYVSTNFTSPDAMVDFVQWGTSAHVVFTSRMHLTTPNPLPMALGQGTPLLSVTRWTLRRAMDEMS